MPERTDSYEEILALNPKSQIFFPLASELAAQGKYQRAVKILRHGLRFHPNYLEARFLLVEALNACGEKSACADEAQNISNVLRSYPSLWEILGSTARKPGEALLWRIASLLGQEKELDLLDILNRGLTFTPEQTMPSMAAPVSLAPPHSFSVVRFKPTPHLVSASAQNTSPAKERQQSQLTEASSVFSAAKNKSLLSSTSSANRPPHPSKTSSLPSAPQDISSAQRDAVSVADTFATGLSALREAKRNISEQQPNPPIEESVNLRTRSMADVLSEQGDIEGALRIYEELLQDNPDSELLRYRIAELRRQLSSSPRTSLPNSLRNQDESPDNKNNNVIEAVAPKSFPITQEKKPNFSSTGISCTLPLSKADKDDALRLQGQVIQKKKTTDKSGDFCPKHLEDTASPLALSSLNQLNAHAAIPDYATETSSPLMHQPVIAQQKITQETESQLPLAHLLEQLAERLEARALR